MSRNRKRNNVRRKRRSIRRKRQAPLHIPSVQIQPWRRITLVLDSTGIDTYEAFAIESIRSTLASQTTLTIDVNHPYLIKISRIRIWNQGRNSILGPLGLMPFSLLNSGINQEPLNTFEDHPVGTNPARVQFSWPRLHQQIIFHTQQDEKKLAFAVHSRKDDKLILHLVISYKPVKSADFVMHSGSALTTSLREMEMH